LKEKAADYFVLPLFLYTKHPFIFRHILLLT